MIAILVTLGQIIIHITLENQIEDSYIINIAGRQRMLSQKISKFALSITLPQTEQKMIELISELKHSADQWQMVHAALQYGSSELGVSAENSQIIKELFKKVNPSFFEILNASNAIIKFEQVQPKKMKNL